MKRILITGADSYIGTSFEAYIRAHYAGAFVIDTVDMVDGSWRTKSFAGYDSVFHVADIAHSNVGRISPERAQLYYKVNTELAIETAQKAKRDGVGQFIFMSSAIVYGDNAPIGRPWRITRETPLNPANCYGDSKVQAEKGLTPLCSDTFRVVILRPPMVYGKGSKGNYVTLARIAASVPVFPVIQNSRSMLYIENLCEFVRLMIEHDESGIFWPQNAEYSNTSEMVRMIAEAHGHKVILLKGFGWAMKCLGPLSRWINKAFGNMCYAQELSVYPVEYRIRSLAESIRCTEEA